ncbi:MAG: YebC/PmpR family DNA-binding transcriptional regulator [Phycisphaerales bacterium]|nr:YebC/PmpR family DNA-binding transcriptional regulator [Phycisphaerales bacterium]MCB9856376.1 YebC/PmpR family DNA-binding transcriptional regulator [Phycisphaerales bacterium]MCB9864048.1 YebC/PmpR family DNA-binding transcriptional regulator [Phycisphaerales bacterium]
MAGHSKWANIKHKKAAIDNKRGKLWSKLARNIIVAAKHGGGDPAANLTLRYAIDKAKEANMPNDTIDKAIKKGTGDLGGAEYVPASYEGYGPGGVAVIVDALTDNPNRTAPEIKKIFERAGGNLGSPNCVSWNFATKGVFTVDAVDADEETLMEIAIDAGAEDVKPMDGMFEITCEVESFAAVRDALSEKKIKTQTGEITKIPGTTITIDADTGAKVLRMIEAFEDHDDVQNVYANFDMPEEVMAQLGG